uniref:Uncharacterized protein n=1 Tax=Oncorhynchus kisutch TaxID=8019 RepID=A0A8C7K5P4_ONCKI
MIAKAQVAQPVGDTIFGKIIRKEIPLGLESLCPSVIVYMPYLNDKEQHISQQILLV